jgi:hypothetical protein
VRRRRSKKQREARAAEWKQRMAQHEAQSWKVWLGPKDEQSTRFWSISSSTTFGDPVTSAAEALAYVERQLIAEVKAQMRSVVIEGPGA